MADGIGNPQAVLFEEHEAAGGFRLGIATLNAEKALNSLGLDMVRLLNPMLERWAADPRIACVVLRGAGERALCAGGDVRYLRQVSIAPRAPRHNPLAQAFFSEEYRLDYKVHHFPKPVLAWGSGVVMGGGLGLLAGASHAVVTETSRLAMPEITIGLHPDAGGSWFLRQVPGRTGLFMAMTGAQLNGHDALATGLASDFLRAADYPALLARMYAMAWSGDAQADRAALSVELASLGAAAEAAKPACNITAQAETIEQMTAGGSLLDAAAQIAGYAGDDPWMKKAVATFKAGSPTTVALVWEIWRRVADMSLAQALRMELVVSLQCCEHPDFPEGVRALLVDKDNQPRWTPASLAEVSDEWVAEHFAAPWAQGEAANPLNDLE